MVIELYFVTSSVDHRIGCAACTAIELYFVTSVVTELYFVTSVVIELYFGMLHQVLIIELDVLHVQL